MSLRPKPVWSKTKSSGLPQYYKDKLPSNTYGSSTVNWFNFKGKKRQMLTRLFIASIALYFTLSWLVSKPTIKSESHELLSGKALWNHRRDQVKEAFVASWDDYTKNAWGSDIYSPIKRKGKNMKVDGPLGWIIVDSLDTLVLMNLKDQLEDAKSWVSYELNYEMDNHVHTFETTIRMLGGLLSTYYLTEDEVFAEKAVNLGNKLLAAFDTENGIPASEVNLKTGAIKFDPSGVSTSEITTLQLEFKYLASITGEAMYWDAVDNIMKLINKANNEPLLNARDGLVPIFMNPKSGLYNSELIRLGSRADSYYEYLLKQYLQTGEQVYLDMYNESFNGIKKHLTGRSRPNNYLFLGELERGLGGPLSSKMDHLVCFFGGLFALGATNGLTLAEAKKQKWWDQNNQEQLNYAEELANTCYHMYHDVPTTGLSPEIVVFNIYDDVKKYAPTDAYWSTGGDFFVKKSDAHNLQRPETVETLYYLYKITGDEKYRDWGWEIFENFIKFTGIGGPEQLGGYEGPLRFTSLKDVFKSDNIGRFADNMESFWLAETLKYLYLLFTDDDVEGGKKWKKWGLQNIVFNTEAHPLPRLDNINFATGWTPTSENQSNVIELNKGADNEKDVAHGVEKKATSNEIEQKESGQLVDFDFSEKSNEVQDEQSRGLDDIAIAKNKEIAEEMLSKGEKPVAKGKVSKSLNEQALDINKDLTEDNDKIESIDDLDPALEAELF